MKNIVSHVFDGPYQACTVDECGLSRNASLHVAGEVLAALTDERIHADIRIRANIRNTLRRLAKVEEAMQAVLAIEQQPGAGDYNRALADVRNAIIESLV